MLYLASALLTPLAALTGSVLVFVALEVVLGPAFAGPRLSELLGLGVVLGSLFAAPVTLAILPFLARRWQRGEVSGGRVVLLSMATGCGSSMLAPAVLFLADLARMWPLILLLGATGAAMAAVCAAVLLALAVWLAASSPGAAGSAPEPPVSR